MTNQHDDHTTDPVLAALRSADPATGRQPAEPDARLLQEILMSDTIQTTTPADEFGPPPARVETANPGRARRFAITGAAAAAVAVAGVTAVSFVGPGVTPAAAAAIEAAEETADVESGTALVTVTAEHDGEQESLELSLVFDDADTAFTISGLDESPAEPERAELRVVDGVIYASMADDEWFAIDDDRVSSLLDSTGLSVDMRTDLADAIITLMTEAEGVTEVESGHFSGTVTTAEVADLAASLPSFAMFGDLDARSTLGDGDVVAGTFQVDLTVDGEGRIDIFTVSADAADFESPNISSEGTGTMSVSIDFDDLGEPQTIEAPAEVIELDLESMLSDD